MPSHGGAGGSRRQTPTFSLPSFSVGLSRPVQQRRVVGHHRSYIIPRDPKQPMRQTYSNHRAKARPQTKDTVDPHRSSSSAGANILLAAGDDDGIFSRENIEIDTAQPIFSEFSSGYDTADTTANSRKVR